MKSPAKNSGKTAAMWILAGTLAALTLLFGAVRWNAIPDANSARVSVRSALGTHPTEPANAMGFERALARRKFNFPADHGPHPRYRHEWWYFTGNLRADNGARMGYQLTFFRVGLKPPKLSGLSGESLSDNIESDWRTDAVFMAHLAVTDIDGKRFIESERFSRVALGLAGAEASPFRVWLDDWQAVGNSQDTFELKLQAQTDRVNLALELLPGKPIVLQGDQGLSPKSAAPGNASYYYSMPRMPTIGTISIDGARYQLAGNSWLDREWGTSALGPDQAGWDWFALQLDDGTELMFYQLRDLDGNPGEMSAGTLIGTDGNATPLRADSLVIEVAKRWKSSQSGVVYPAGWRIHAPDYQLDLTVTPLLDDQELNLTVRYWEGAVKVEGSAAGVGYVELAGY